MKSSYPRRSARLNPCRVHKNYNSECIVNFSEDFKKKQKEVNRKFMQTPQWLEANVFPSMLSSYKQILKSNTRKGKFHLHYHCYIKNCVDKGDDAMKLILDSYKPDKKIS